MSGEKHTARTPINNATNFPLPSLLAQRERTHALLEHTETRLPRTRTNFFRACRLSLCFRLLGLLRSRLCRLPGPTTLCGWWELDIDDTHDGSALQNAPDFICIPRRHACRRARARARARRRVRQGGV